VVRDLTRSAQLNSSQLILPIFVRHGHQDRQEIASMPGQGQISVDLLGEVIHQAAEVGVRGFILFGIPSKKDATGSDSCHENGIIQQAIRAAKKAVPDVLLITDVCFCEYTDHGHCGIVNQNTGRLDVDNDATLQLLSKQAVSHAEAGADIVAPSGMIDGMVGAIRQSLDGAGFSHLPILSYAAKYASAFYGPFREAAESAPQFGDRRTYQMDPAVDVGQALREVALDLREGADMIMIKPALAYLDVLTRVRENFPGVPLAVYNVSGEYSLVKAAADRGWVDERATVLEMLTAMRRAGADMIFTYWAVQVAHWLQDQ
jgi:porphobilinogen synthase